MRSLPVIIAILLLTYTATAQKYSWAKHFNPTGASNVVLTEGRVITRDNAGNLYVAGTYGAATDFDPGTGVLILPSAGNYTAFIAKLDAAGNLVWAKGLGGSTTILSALAVGNDGAVYSTGYFKGTNLDFDPGPAIYPLSASSVDIFISKLDADGNFVWVKKLGSSSIDDARGIAVDDNNNVYIGGDYNGNIDIDPGPAVVTLTSSFKDAFLLKLNQNGEYISSYSISGPAEDYCWGVVLKNNFIHMITWSASKSAAHKFTTDMQLVWTKTTEGLGAWPRSIAVDNAGNTIISGIFNGTVDFDPGPGVRSITATGSLEMFIYKLDANGNFKWLRYTPGTSISTGSLVASNGLYTNEQGDIFIAGQFSIPYTFNPGSPSSQLTPQNSDVFIEKLNYAGQFQWVIQMGGPSNDVARSVYVDAQDNMYTTGYFIGTSDFNPNPATINSLTAFTGESAVFISKLSRGNYISGKVFKDFNSDGIQQSGEPAYVYAVPRATRNSSVLFGLTGSDGTYNIAVDTGSYSISLPQVPLYHTSSVTVHNAAFTVYGLDDTANDFAIHPIPGINDLKIVATTNARARRGEVMSLLLTCNNLGTTILSGDVTLQHDAQLVYKQALPAPDSYTGSLLTWHFSNMQPNETRNIYIEYDVPTTIIGNPVFANTAIISPMVNDTTPYNNQNTVNTELIGSYDPNDKTVLPVGPVSPDFISADTTSLQYVIRFQNTGNDTAFLVVLRDTLDAKLDLKTLQIIGGSHPFKATIQNGNELVFSFNNILLPDSTTNEPLSHGFAAFTIKPLTSLQAGDSVTNKAAIYFDYNNAVITNTAVTHISSTLPVTLSFYQVNVLPNCSGVSVSFTSSTETGNASYTIERSTDGNSWTPVTTIVGAINAGSSKQYNYVHMVPVSFTVFYRLKQTDIDGRSTYSSIKRVNCATANVKIYPNPVANFLTIEAEEMFSYNIFDAKGSKVLSGNSASTIKKINMADMGKGNYFLQVKTNAGIEFYTVIKQ